MSTGTLAGPDLPRAFPRCELTEAQFDALPVEAVPIESLIPSQDDVSLYHLVAVLNRWPDRDYVGRAIYWQGRLNLYDGHHHWIIAAARSEKTFKVRIYTPEAGE